MLLRVDRFRGMNPKVSSKLLEAGQSVSANNCDFRSGALVPIKTHSFVATPDKPGTKLSIFYYANQYWFHWTTDVDAVNSPVNQDAWARVYYTGDGVPKMTAQDVAIGTLMPTGWYNLGIPRPTAAPTHTMNGSPAGSDPPTSYAYVYTRVSAYGEEGPPSDPIMIDVSEGEWPTLTGLVLTPGGAYNISKMNIYRANAGTSGAIFQYLGETATASFTDKDPASNNVTPGDDLQEQLPSADWHPPLSTLAGLTAMPGGVLAGFSGNTLCFSEPFQPHAWPPEYQLSTEYDIVGLAAFGNSLLVATKGTPYIASGFDPRSTTLTKLEFAQSCVSKRSIVDLGTVVLYASPDGMIAVASGGSRNVTENVMSKEYWQTLTPSSITGSHVDGKYVGFYNNGTPGSFILDPSTGDFQLCEVSADAAFNDLASDSLYVINSGDIRKWEGSATDLNFTWKSKVFTTDQPTNFGWAQVEARAYTNLTIKIWADGVLKVSRSVTSAQPFRLPAGFYATDWQFEVAGKDIVDRVLISNSADELRSV